MKSTERQERQTKKYRELIGVTEEGVRDRRAKGRGADQEKARGKDRPLKWRSPNSGRRSSTMVSWETV